MPTAHEELIAAESAYLDACACFASTLANYARARGEGERNPGPEGAAMRELSRDLHSLCGPAAVARDEALAALCRAAQSVGKGAL